MYNTVEKLNNLFRLIKLVVKEKKTNLIIYITLNYTK